MSIELNKALSEKDYIFVDVRSPKEYLEDHIIGAYNIPLLDNEERAIIGTLYKQEGKEIAVNKGYQIVNPKLDNITREFRNLFQSDKEIIVYCFRGGMRSTTVVEYLRSVGIKARKLEGGYKSYRKFVMDYLEDLSYFEFIILHGHTGVGKTELLLELKSQGKYILDLEDYACNSGSVFGEIYYKGDNPSQKFFETRIFNELREARESGNKYIYMESESKKIGRCNLGVSFWEKMIEGRHIYVEASLESRVKRCVLDYTKKCWDNDDKLIRAIAKLKDTIGNVKVEELTEATKLKDYTKIAGFLMEKYYDPLYQHSINKYEYIKMVSSENIEQAVKEIMDGENIY
ncbi:MAG: tRNA 2-selenouridine(34) synthase MnmH [Filifactoraceae bacterium]